MRVDITSFEKVVNNILTQLNKLNTDIIFHYYIECKTSKKYKKVVDLNDNMILMSRRYMPVDNDDIEVEVEKYFPYYYKMSRLYAHLSAIVDLDKNSFSDSFENCGYSILYDEYNPSPLISDEISTIDFSQYDLDDDTMNYFNQELKVLMKNANKLNTDFKKYGSSEVAFFTECDMNDYKYLENKEVPQEIDVEWSDDDSVLKAYYDPSIEKELQAAAIKEIEDDINNSFATTKIIPPSNVPFTKVDVNRDSNSALKKIGELYACGTLSKKTAQKMSYDVISNNYKTCPLCDDNSFRNWATNPEETKKIFYDRDVMKKFEELQKNHDEMFHKIMNKNGK